MSNKKTKIEGRLTAKGTESAKAKVTDDLAVPDPEPSTGRKIFNDAITKDAADDDKPGDS